MVFKDSDILLRLDAAFVSLKFAVFYESRTKGMQALSFYFGDRQLFLS